MNETLSSFNIILEAFNHLSVFLRYFRKTYFHAVKLRLYFSFYLFIYLFIHSFICLFIFNILDLMSSVEKTDMPHYKFTQYRDFKDLNAAN